MWLASPGEGNNFVLVLLGGGALREQDKDDMTHYGFAVASRHAVRACIGSVSMGRSASFTMSGWCRARFWA